MVDDQLPAVGHGHSKHTPPNTQGYQHTGLPSGFWELRAQEAIIFSEETPNVPTVLPTVKPMDHPCPDDL